MSLTIELALAYEFAVKAPFKTVFDLLSAVPASASHFPDVDKLTDLGGNRYRWQMRPVGTPQVHLQTTYASAYVSDRKKGTVTWTPIPGEGNAQVSGSWTLTRQKSSTLLVLRIQGAFETPFPQLMKVVVSPIVSAEFERLVETYIDRLIEHLGGEV